MKIIIRNWSSLSLSRIQYRHFLKYTIHIVLLISNGDSPIVYLSTTIDEIANVFSKYGYIHSHQYPVLRVSAPQGSVLGLLIFLLGRLPNWNLVYTIINTADTTVCTLLKESTMLQSKIVQWLKLLIIIVNWLKVNKLHRNPNKAQRLKLSINKYWAQNW